MNDLSVITRFTQAGQSFTLPGDPDANLMLCPVSGGADSAALAILLAEMFPNVNWVYAFTDTKAEHPSVYETLERLESWLGRPIVRLEPEAGLYDLLDRWDFLPNAQNRWCTKHLKLMPFRRFVTSIRQRPDQEIFCFVGIRADESTRIAFTDPSITTVMPFIDLGIDREAVFRILDRTIGIPRLYRGRSRSSCSTCPFMRRSESLALLRDYPGEFKKGMGYEKLAVGDEARFQAEAVDLSRETGLAANHLSLPVPPAVDARGQGGRLLWGRIRHGECASLFEEPMPFATLWVGAEFLVHPGVGDHGVWWQEIVTFSSTKGGLTRQLNSHYAHRLDTAEVLGLTQEELREELRYAVYRIEVPANLMDAGKASATSFTGF